MPPICPAKFVEYINMKYKELIRKLITAEMQDISLYTSEAKAFGANPVHGEKISGLFQRLADEELKHLKSLGEATNENTGFRYRNTETPRSIEAALRAHTDREKTSIAMYRELFKLLKKPEAKETIKALITQERAHLAEIQELQALLKKA